LAIWDGSHSGKEKWMDGFPKDHRKNTPSFPDCNVQGLERVKSHKGFLTLGFVSGVVELACTSWGEPTVNSLAISQLVVKYNFD
jgi:hypothetical protein